MRNDRHLAIKYRKKGRSYKQISKDLGVPKSTLNYWFQNLSWSKDIKKSLTEKARLTSRKRIKKIIKSNRARWRKWRENFKTEAREEFRVLKVNSLFIAGVMLYWGEGDQNTKYQVRLSNVNYRMIALFNKFLKEVCNIKEEDIHFSLFIYPDINKKKCKIFWSEKIKVKLDQFDKVQVIHGRHPTKRLENGICVIRVAKSTGFKEKILVWINMLNEILIRKSYKMRV